MSEQLRIPAPETRKREVEQIRASNRMLDELNLALEELLALPSSSPLTKVLPSQPLPTTSETAFTIHAKTAPLKKKLIKLPYSSLQPFCAIISKDFAMKESNLGSEPLLGELHDQ